MELRKVNQNGRVSTCTFAVDPIQNEKTGKWACEFETWVVKSPEDSYKAASCTSPAHFESKQAALEAASRALDVLAETERYPNMCEPW